MNFFISYLWRDPAFFFAAAFIVCFSICLHEFCHAYAALRAGDSTAADRGHLTLNPLKQMGVFSIVMFLLVGVAWGRVPVNPGRLRHRHSDALVAFSGPAANLALFLVFVALAAVCAVADPEDKLRLFVFAFYGGMINLVLAFLNLIPVPGLDGWAILSSFFPKLPMTDSEFIRGFFMVMIVLVFVSIKYLFQAAQVVTLALIALLIRLLQSGGGA